MGTGVDALTASAEEWTCDCGRLNVAGLSMCPNCGRRPPRGLATLTTMGPGRQAAEWRPPVRSVRLAFRIIGLGVLFHVIVAGLIASGKLETNEAINIGVWGGFVFYAIVLAVVIGPVLATRPRWVAGDPKTAALLGAEVGFAAAAVVTAVFWAVGGQPSLDTFNRLLVSEATPTRILIAVVYGCVAAPIVEELLFRGVVAESLRPRGTLTALLVSAFLFALWHLLLTPYFIVYYTIMGLIFGGLYWRRGLQASMAAHAAFNGTLIVLAIIVALGPGHLFSDHGVAVHAPGGWDKASVEDTGIDLGLEGPGGSTFAVRHEGLPPNAGLDLDSIASAVNNSPGSADGRTTIVPNSARVVTYPAGQAVQFSATRDGKAAEVLFIPSGGKVFEIDVATAGSARAKRDYPDMLASLTLPNE